LIETTYFGDKMSQIKQFTTPTTLDGLGDAIFFKEIMLGISGTMIVRDRLGNWNPADADILRRILLQALLSFTNECQACCGTQPIPISPSCFDCEVFFVGTVVVTHNMLTEPFRDITILCRGGRARSIWIDHLNPYGDQASLEYPENASTGDLSKRVKIRVFRVIQCIRRCWFGRWSIWIMRGASSDLDGSASHFLDLVAVLLLDLYPWRIASWLLGYPVYWGAAVFILQSRGIDL